MQLPIIHTFPPEILQHSAAQFIATFLVEQLEKKKPILLLLSGGSAIGMYQEMFQILLDRKTSLSTVWVSLFDERFVMKGSLDSNEQQLKDAGVINLFESAGATWIPYLSQDQTTGESVAKEISKTFSTMLTTHRLIILAGLGDDGHTAGLLPVKKYSNNKERLFNPQELVAYYEVDSQDSDNPFHKRLTSTQMLIQEAEQVILFTSGEKKRTAFEKFLQNTEPLYRCPALVLYKSKQLPIILTDLSAE